MSNSLRRTVRTVPLPPELTERVRRHLAGEASGGSHSVEPRHASTVMLLRDGAAGGLDVYLLRRAGSMAFAGGYHAFPGGGVGADDGDPGVAWRGPAPSWWATRLGSDEATARALVCAAVRETYEESGVLLAAGDETSDEPAAPDSDPAAADAERVALAAHELSLAELLRRRGLRIAADLIAPWARWLTPEFERRRYDTAFFVAAVPADRHPATSRGRPITRAGGRSPTRSPRTRQGRSRCCPPPR